MLPSFCRETVTVRRAPMVAARGTGERDWSAAESHYVTGCSVQPSSTSTEAGEPRYAASDSYALFAPPGSDIRRGDRIECVAGSFDVDGNPMAFESPSGAVSHVRCQLSRWEG